MAKNLAMVALIDTYSAVLTDKQREMLELYYYEDLSLAEIAQNCGISRQGVRDSIKRGEAAILELEDKLHFAKKQGDLYARLDRIRSCTQDILVVNDTQIYSEAIRTAAEEIASLVEREETED